MKGVRILVPSIRGVNFRFWSHFGNTIIDIIFNLYVAVKVSFKVPHEEIRKITYLYALNVVFFRGQKNPGLCYDLPPFKISDEMIRTISYAKISPGNIPVVLFGKEILQM